MLAGACRSAPPDPAAQAWDAAARREDPAGFLEYARVRLTGDLAQLREVEVEAASRAASGAAALERARELHSKAEELLGPFRLAYRRAEAGEGYPVQVAGISIASREAFLEQVSLTLGERDGYAQRVADWPVVLAALDELAAGIPERGQTVAATLELVDAQKDPSLLFLDRVDAVLFETSESLRALEVALADARALAAAPKPGAAGTEAALAYLEGR
jgi:hypothetical protein